MKRAFRLTSALLVFCVLHLSIMPCIAAGQAVLPPAEAKVTTNDPQFIPLSEEQEIKKGVPWYVYVIGVVLIGGLAAAGGGGGGGGGGSSSTPTATTGSVTGSW
jgi:hypothetical protein